MLHNVFPVKQVTPGRHYTTLYVVTGLSRSCHASDETVERFIHGLSHNPPNVLTHLLIVSVYVIQLEHLRGGSKNPTHSVVLLVRNSWKFNCNTKASKSSKPFEMLVKLVL